MPRFLLSIPVLALSAATAFAQAPAAKPAAAKQAATGAKAPLVEFEMMTWPEVKAALAAGKLRRSCTPAAPNNADRRTSTAVTL